MRPDERKKEGLPETPMAEWLGIVEITEEELGALERKAVKWRMDAAGCAPDAPEGGE